MMLAIQTQCFENYGSPSAPYWKPKGGQVVKVTDLPLGLTRSALDDLAMVVELDGSDMSFETVIGWSIEADDYLSDFERSQLEYEGQIVFREPTISYADAVNILLEAPCQA